MAKDYEHMNLFEQIKNGLEDSAAYSRGELTLRTVELPEPPPAVRACDVVRLRKSLSMSQAVFAAALNVSPKTVQSWEQGEREPSDVALRMLQIIREEPKVIRLVFKTSTQTTFKVTKAPSRFRATVPDTGRTAHRAVRRVARNGGQFIEKAGKRAK